jgi:hypothetical protein
MTGSDVEIPLIEVVEGQLDGSIDSICCFSLFSLFWIFSPQRVSRMKVDSRLSMTVGGEQLIK